MHSIDGLKDRFGSDCITQGITQGTITQGTNTGDGSLIDECCDLCYNDIGDRNAEASKKKEQ